MPEIYCKDCEHFDKCVRGYMPDCPVYYPKKGIMTNEEWFCGLSTEEKAEFFVKIELSAMHPVKRGSIDTKKFIEDVTEWLKQQHKE